MATTTCPHTYRVTYTDAPVISGVTVGGTYSRCQQCGRQTLNGRQFAGDTWVGPAPDTDPIPATKG